MWWHQKKKQNLKIIDTVYESYMMGCWMSGISIILVVKRNIDRKLTWVRDCWGVEMLSQPANEKFVMFPLTFWQLHCQYEISIILFVWWSHIPMLCLIHDRFNFPCLSPTQILGLDCSTIPKITAISNWNLKFRVSQSITAV